MAAVSRKPPSKFLAALQTESVELRKISEDFRPLGGKFNIVSFYEEHANPLLGKVVSCTFSCLFAFLASCMLGPLVFFYCHVTSWLGDKC
jgi:hypothetical protein